jgi:beta-mannosidase
MAQAVITATDVPEGPGVALGPWSCCARPPGAITHPDQLRGDPSNWLPAPVPGTVAAALRAAGRWDFNRPIDLDAQDWWYHTTFVAPEVRADHPCHLCLDGLATLAEVWLNGHRVLATDNMFRAYRVDVAPHLGRQNELVIGFRSLAEDLKRKRPRPRWKTALVNQQQMRWHRTTLLGRIPGWSPPAPAVGPWRAVRLDPGPLSVSDLRLASRLDGDAGVVTLQAVVDSAAPVTGAVLEVDGHEAAVEVRANGGRWRLSGTVRLANPPLWWPHTHGTQPLAECALHLRAGDRRTTVRCGKVGFRRLYVPREDGFSIHVNGAPVYCRGACWTAADVLLPGGSDESVARDLRLARDAGANMLRVGGTMVYESDAFYRLCDELGILVWQDFMFANMDYPVDEEGFAANIEAEARHQLGRLSGHPSVAVLCGNSEVEQQAAMVGVPRPLWRNRWFADRLPGLCAEYCAGIPYIPSSPSGGALPFHLREGVAHYYGVGAYLRPPAELRRADVKFAAECLAFANIPEPAAVDAIMDGGPPAVHHPRWKQRTPRDTGAGWDFDDVRDHYLQQCFAVDPVRLRSFDMGRYLQLSRVVTGEMMAQVFSEWRGGHSRSGGGLVWFFKDLWPAAGWGVIDSFGIPKAAYYYLRRAWSTRQVTLTDEGLDGLHLHAINETAEPFNGRVELLLLRDGHIVVARQEVPCELPPRSRQTLVADAVLGNFYDLTYSYRFGPPKYDVAVVTLFDSRRRVLSEAFHLVQPRDPPLLPAINLDAQAEPTGDGGYRVTLHSDRFLQSVSFDASGWLPDDNYFHLVPTRPKVVRFAATGGGNPRFRAHVEALNLRTPVAVRPKETPA